MRRITILMSVLLAAGSLYAQADKTYQAEDNRQRGYYNRPWLRYEAETGKCQTNVTVLPASTANANIQSEATNQVAVNLVNKGDYVGWTNEKAANAMTIRFSLPDNATGEGTEGKLELYVNGQKVNVYQTTRHDDDVVLRDDILLDSYWAWQYFTGNANVAYQYKTSSTNIFRMRFDEVILRTEVEIPAGSVFKLVKEDNNASPYTIDFVELEKVEPVTFESIEGEKVKYEGDGGDLQAFINDNGGKTIYIPEGKYNVPVRLYINDDNTKIQGAGIFYTELFFSAPLDDDNFKSRGFESASNRVGVDGMYINGVLSQRYYQRDDDKQPGKGFNGSFGSNSVISNVLVQHFECGAWLQGANKLTMEHLRIRNNYADGTNLAGNCKNSVVRYVSYRNNGDDDMASWSNAGLAENITFQYNTSECNWRASGIGIFGGSGHKVNHCLVVDAIESGLRLDTSYGGSAFFEKEYMELSDLSFYNCGTAGRSSVWNEMLPTILIKMKKVNGYHRYVRNAKFNNIDLIDNRNVAIQIIADSGSDKPIKGVSFENVNIKKASSGISVGNSVIGEVNYYNVNFEDCTNEISNNASAKKFVLCNRPFGESCAADAVFVPAPDGSFTVLAENGNVEVSGAEAGTEVFVYNMLGQKVAESVTSEIGNVRFTLNAGAYVVVSGNIRVKIVF